MKMKRLLGVCVIGAGVLLIIYGGNIDLPGGRIIGFVAIVGGVMLLLSSRRRNRRGHGRGERQNGAM